MVPTIAQDVNDAHVHEMMSITPTSTACRTLCCVHPPVCDGALVGADEGELGWRLGWVDGCDVGEVGSLEGWLVGVVGRSDGCAVG
jgi:hypothetical protein